VSRPDHHGRTRARCVSRRVRWHVKPKRRQVPLLPSFGGRERDNIVVRGYCTLKLVFAPIVEAARVTVLPYCARYVPASACRDSL